MANRESFVIEDAQLMFRNFAGRERDFNEAGNRNFCILLDDETEKTLRDLGWNVKTLKPREDEEKPQAYIQVKVNYKKGRPPRCVMISEGGKKRTELGADEVELLDVVDIARADVSINPYNWEVRGESGITAYLKSIFVTISEDELDLKYATPPGVAEVESVDPPWDTEEDD